jgi:hypothetical protein
VTVADLQQHLTDLGRLLQASGAKQVADELVGVAAHLTPFRSHRLTDFGRFLAQANEYATSGTLPVVAAKGRAGAAKAGPAAPRAEPAAVAEAVRRVYDRAGDLSLGEAEIDAALGPVASLPMAGLKIVAAVLELKLPPKAKVDEARQLIRQKVFNRRGAAQRSGMTGLPPSSGA